MSALSDTLNDANVEGWSAREIARRGGDRVSHSQLGKYLKPSHPRPGEDVLQVFSDVFRIPMPRLRRLAGAPAGDPVPYEPPAEANRLDSRQRRLVNELIRVLAETKAGDGDGRDTAPIVAGQSGPEPSVDEVLAARRRHDEELAAAARKTPGGGRTSGQRQRDALSDQGEESQDE